MHKRDRQTDGQTDTGQQQRLRLHIASCCNCSHHRFRNEVHVLAKPALGMQITSGYWTHKNVTATWKSYWINEPSSFSRQRRLPLLFNTFSKRPHFRRTVERRHRIFFVAALHSRLQIHANWVCGWWLSAMKTLLPIFILGNSKYRLCSTETLTLRWGTGIRGLMRGMATLLQGNQELLVVKDKIWKTPSLG